MSRRLSASLMMYAALMLASDSDEFTATPKTIRKVEKWHDIQIPKSIRKGLNWEEITELRKAIYEKYHGEANDDC